MPNWCSTNYAVYPRTKSDFGQLLKFYLEMKKATESDFGGPAGDGPDNTDWFGNLFIAAGYKLGEHEELRGYNLRGFDTSVEFREEKGGYVDIYVNMAWTPEYEGMADMLSEKYPGLDFVMVAEEPGCEIYINTDEDHTYYNDKWKIEYEFSDYIDVDGVEQEGWSDSIYFNSDNEVDALSAIEDLSGLKFKSMDEVMKKLDIVEEGFYKTHGGSKATEEGAYLSVHEYVNM